MKSVAPFGRAVFHPHPSPPMILRLDQHCVPFYGRGSEVCSPVSRHATHHPCGDASVPFGHRAMGWATGSTTTISRTRSRTTRARRTVPLQTIEIRRRGAWATGAVLVRALRSGNAPRRLVRRCRRSPRGSGPRQHRRPFSRAGQCLGRGIKMGMATLVSKCDLSSNYLFCPDVSATQSLRVRSAQSSITVPFRQSLLHRTILPAAAWKEGLS